MILIRKITNLSLFRTSSIYTISSFINAAIPFLLLPLLTNALSPEDYGRVAMFQLAVNIIFPFVGMNLDGAAGRMYYDKDNNTNYPSYIGASLILFSGGVLLCVIILFFGSNIVVLLTQLPHYYIKFIILVAGCQFITTFVLAILQVMVRPFSYGILQISQTIVNIGLTTIFILILHKKWEGRIFVLIITGILMAIISICILLKNKLIQFNVKKKYFLYALRYGIPLIPHTLGGMLFISVDRYFLTSLTELAQTGNYTVAYQLGAIISLLTSSINNAFVPWLFDNLNKDSEIIKKKIVIGTYFYFVGLVIVALLLLILLPVIIHIFVGKSFTHITDYTTLIVFGFVFQGMYYMVTNYIAYVKKTHLLALITISIGLIKIPITFFCITSFGAFGASLSHCITFFLFFIFTWILSSRIYKMPWASSIKDCRIILLSIVKGRYL